MCKVNDLCCVGPDLPCNFECSEDSLKTEAMTGEGKGLGFFCPIEVSGRTLTLIMCNLVISSGIFRQAEGEPELLQPV